MGILDSALPQQGGPPPADSFWDRFRAEFAPGAYQAHRDSQREQATYSGLGKYATPEQARAMAMNPQYFQAGQGAYLPAAPQIQTYTNASGEQVPVQVQNPGGGAGHSLSLSGIPIVAPGATPAPTGAPRPQATPGNADVAPSAEQVAGATPPPVTGAPVLPGSPTAAGPTNTLQGMPGSVSQVMTAVDAAKARGIEGEALLGVIPPNFKDMTRAVLDGRLSLKDIAEHRGVSTKNTIEQLAFKVDPGFDNNTAEARQTFRKQYMSGKATDVGGQVKSINKLAGHANAIADASAGMDNLGFGGYGGLARPINKLGNALYTTPGAGLQRAADLYNNELSTYVSGKGGSGAEERKSRAEAFSPNNTPQEMGKTLLTDIDFLRKQIAGNEEHRNTVFPNSKHQEQYPLVSPEALKQLDEAEIKAHKLVGDYAEWAKTDEGKRVHGVKTQGSAAPAPLPEGWKWVD